MDNTGSTKGPFLSIIATYSLGKKGLLNDQTKALVNQVQERALDLSNLLIKWNADGLLDNKRYMKNVYDYVNIFIDIYDAFGKVNLLALPKELLEKVLTSPEDAFFILEKNGVKVTHAPQAKDFFLLRNATKILAQSYSEHNRKAIFSKQRMPLEVLPNMVTFLGNGSLNIETRQVIIRQTVQNQMEEAAVKLTL